MARDARGVYHIGKPEALRTVAANLRLADGKPLAPGYGAVLIPLRYIGAQEMATILRPMALQDAIVRVDSLRNLLVMVGTRNQAEGWLEVVRTFDVDLLKGMSVGLFPLKHATIKEVEAALRLVSGVPGGVPAQAGARAATSATASTPAAAPGAASGAASGAAAGAPEMLGAANPVFGALRVMPVERLNSILVVTPRAEYLDIARRWIEKLDQPGDNATEPQLNIYRVQNGDARHLAIVLGGIFGSSAPAPAQASPIAPGLGSTSASSFGRLAWAVLASPSARAARRRVASAAVALVPPRPRSRKTAWAAPPSPRSLPSPSWATCVSWPTMPTTPSSCGPRAPNSRRSRPRSSAWICRPRRC